MTASSRLMTPAAWLFYTAIVFEFLFMITPLALYFYSAFTPAIALLNSSVWTSWLTAFFLPHFSETSSPLLDGLNSLGWLLSYLGLVLFLVSAVQLYGAKLFRRGAVTGLLYRYVRHPQYLALAILGLGVTLIWPRFLILVTFVTMLFLYRTLARVEESRCIEKYGDSYVRYMEKTGRFVPRFGGRNTGSFDIGATRKRAWMSLAAYLLVVALVLGNGFALREHMLSSVSAIYSDDIAIISPAMLPREKMQKVFDIAASESAVEDMLAAPTLPLLAYVVPADWYLPDLPIDSHEYVRERGGHGTPSDYDRRRFNVLLMTIRTHDRSPMGRDIVRKAYGADPLMLVEVDVGADAVVATSTPPQTVIWGDISPPLM